MKPANKNRPIVILALAVLWAMGVAFAATDDDFVRVDAKGYAEGNRSETPAMALADAERDAVRQVLESLIIPRFIGPATFLLEQPKNYIRTSQIVHEERSADGTLLGIDAYVHRTALSRDAAAIVRPWLPNPPSVVTLIAQTSAAASPELADVTAAETALAEKLTTAGLRVLPSAKVRAQYTQEQLVERYSGDTEMQAQFALENLADVALVGEIAVLQKPASPDSPIETASAQVTIRVIRGHDEKLLDIKKAEATIHSLDSSQGMEQAVQDVAAKLERDLAIAVTLAVAGAEPEPDAIITIENLAEPEQAAEVFDAALNIIGAERMKPLLVTSTPPCHARFRVLSPDPAGTFLSQLTST